MNITLAVLFIAAIIRIISDLDDKNIELQINLIYSEMHVLKNSRIYDYNSSMTSLEILECRGEIDKHFSDSLRIKIKETNSLVKEKDSLYIQAKIIKLKQDVGI